MQFLRTLFWVLVAVAMLIFAVQNNGLVTVNLFGGLRADIKVWLLALGPLLLGFLPTWIVGRVNLWRERKAASAAARRAMETAVPPAAVGPVISVSPDTRSLPAGGVVPGHPAVSPRA